MDTGDRVRYIGINCPEAGDEYGATATEINTDLVLGKMVTLEKDVSDTDRYGRILAYVYVGDLFVNAYLVENGYAQVATYPPDSRGAQASITINTAPNIRCTITVYYKSGALEAQGLEPKNSDGNGNCTWSWKVGTRTTPGNWRIVLTADGVGQTETTFTVTE